MRTLLALIILAAPFAAALPLDTDGADACAIAGGSGACTSAMTMGAKTSFRHTQETLGCDGSTCFYRPTAHLTLEQDAPGTWIARATTYATAYPAGGYIAGTARTLECRVDGGSSCSDQEVLADLVGDPFQSAKWRAEWSLTYVDPLGEPHLQAVWRGEGWLAQYCGCPG